MARAEGKQGSGSKSGGVSLEEGMRRVRGMVGEGGRKGGERRGSAFLAVRSKKSSSSSLSAAACCLRCPLLPPLSSVRFVPAWEERGGLLLLSDPLL